MAKKIFFTSFKGGAGVTACAVGIGAALGKAGERTLIVDGDSRCACALDIAGVTHLKVYTLGDVERGACRAKQAVVQHPNLANLFFLSVQGAQNESCAENAVRAVEGLFDYVLCDKAALGACGQAVVVADPYPPSVRSADVCLSYLKDAGMKDIKLLVNRVNGGLLFDGEIMMPQEIASLLRTPLLAVIPEDLTLPLGRSKKSTDRAFQIAAEALGGKSDKVLSVIKPYYGFNGLIKRKMRERI